MAQTVPTSQRPEVQPFYRSADYRDLTRVLTAGAIAKLIDLFGMLQATRHQQVTPQQWTAKAVEQTLEDVWENANTKAQAQAFEDLFIVSSLLVLDLAKRGATKDNVNQMAAMFDMLAAITSTEDDPNGEWADDPVDADDDDYYYEGESPYDRPGLAYWQERTLDDITDYMREWVHEFRASPEWAQVPQPVDEVVMARFALTLTEQAYNDYRKTPKTWSKAVLTAILDAAFVAPADLDEQSARWVAPSFQAFMVFLKRRHYLRPEVADRYAKWIAASAPVLIRAAATPEHRRPMKNVALAMQQANVDVTDEKAVAAFMPLYNQTTALQRLLADQDYAAADVYFPPALPAGGKHVERFAGRKWVKAWATRLHAEGLELARRLWSDPASDALRRAVPQAIAVQTIVDVYDDLYAEKLLTPKHWQPADFAEAVAKLKKRRQGAALTQALLALGALLEALTQAGQVRPETAAAMLKVITEATPKHGGKVISLKQARKLRSNGHR
ncbi:hypothetical protein ACFQ3L_09875 [Lacticaseibacillus jixianensis]|uniref:Uncharacterized protein n=1 Tax=Lacticaseibacillus jixianensis TaxID=2486012 RepID=A0ABW4BA44_9LACO|nr:hypothetical protein [Lacticaseibacillus jixianensis]